MRLTNAQAGDELLVNGSTASSGTVTVAGATFNYAVTSAGGKIEVVLSGAATPAQYNAALQAVTFRNTTESPASIDRQIEVFVTNTTFGTSSNQALSTIHVTPVNDPPTIVSNEISMIASQTAAQTGSVLANDSDVDTANVLRVYDVANSSGQPALVTATGTTIAGDYGTLTIRADGTYSYVLNTTDPAVQSIPFGATLKGTFHSTSDNPDTTDRIITVTVSDGSDTSNTATSTIHVVPVNDAPIAVNDPLSTAEDTTLTTNIIQSNGVDSDPDSAALSIASAMIDADGNGTPEALVLGTATPILVGGKVIGTLTLTSTGDLTFVPSSNYHGPVPALTYSITDGIDVSNTAVVTLSVTSVNDAPEATDNTADVTEDTPAFGNVITGAMPDRDLEGDRLAVAQFQIAGDPTVYAAGQTAILPGVGTLLINPNGGWIFTPTLNYAGPVPVATYTLSDGNGGTDTATLTLTMLPVNDPPLAANDGPIAVTEDTPVSGNVLPNDGDIDGNALAVVSFTVPGAGTVAAGAPAVIPGVGTLVIRADGSFTFTPALNYVGPVPSATYTITDGTAASSAVLPFANVTPVNDAPVDDNEIVTVAEDAPLIVADGSAQDLLHNALDVDGGAPVISEFMIAGEAGPFVLGTPYAITGVGQVTINADGSYSFVPVANFNGTVPVISYTVMDGVGGSDTSTLSLTVTPVNDDPIDADELNETAEDTRIIVADGSPQDLLANSSDIDGGQPTITAYSIAGESGPYIVGVPYLIADVGRITIGADGSYSFAPVANFTGQVPVITYTVSDGAGGVNTSSLALTITPVNDAPEAANDGPLAVVEDTPATGSVLPNDGDIEGDPLSVTEFAIDTNGDGIPEVFTAGDTATIPGAGSLVINVDGAYTFTPAPNYVGPVPTATYTVTDGTDTDTATLAFADITPVNDAPVAANDGPIAVIEDTPATGSVLPNDGDVEGDPLSVTEFAIDTNGDGVPEVFTAGDIATIPGAGSLVIKSTAPTPSRRLRTTSARFPSRPTRSPMAPTPTRRRSPSPTSRRSMMCPLLSTTQPQLSNLVQN